MLTRLSLRQPGVAWGTGLQYDSLVSVSCQPVAQEAKASLGSGVYTLPDAARLLGVPLTRLRSWISGYAIPEEPNHGRRLPAGHFSSRGEGRAKTFSFHTLIEIYVIAQLRKHRVTMATVRKAREELSERFDTAHPFAVAGLLLGGKRLLKELGNQTLLELGTGGQTGFEAVIAPFCERLDFDQTTRLAQRFYPNGRNNAVVIDPHHAFGRPIIEGTNITTEALASLMWGGEKLEDVAANFGLEVRQVEEAWAFEQRVAA